jgi:type VI protein secretion system component VasK
MPHVLLLTVALLFAGVTTSAFADGDASYKNDPSYESERRAEYRERVRERNEARREATYERSKRLRYSRRYSYRSVWWPFAGPPGL